MCGYCDILNIDKEVDPPTPFDENDFNRLSNDVWIGAVTISILPPSIYFKTVDYLMGGVKKGISQSIKPKVKKTVAKILKENASAFGDKSKQEVIEIAAEKMAESAIAIAKKTEIALEVGLLEKKVIEQIIAEKYITESILIDIVFEQRDLIMIADLTENIYLFSGAKTYQEVRVLTNLLLDPELKSNFFKFKEKALEIFSDYNEAYLQAEYQTALASARMASDWKRIEIDKDVLPLLKYQTVGDGRVRPTHQQLDNIVRPVNDPFWKQYYPPNGWRCRCTVAQLAEDEEPLTDMSNFTPPDDVPPLFNMNAGIDKYIFKPKGKDKHPYFDIAKGDKEAAKVNWNLPPI